jgi:cell division protein FtsW
VVLCALALLAIGVIMVNSASMSVEAIQIRQDGATDGIATNGVTFASILRSPAAMHMAAALVALVVAACLPIGRMTAGATRLGRSTGPIVLAAGVSIALLVVLSTVYWPGIAKPQNGSHRWIRLGPLDSFQPSEIAKWSIIWVVAAYCVWIGRERLRTFWFGFLPIIGCVGVVSACVVIEDLGTGVLMASASGLVLLAAGARWRHFALFLGLGATGVVAAILQNPYRIDRVIAFLDPYADPQGTGFHMIQSMATVSGGGVTGRGLGHGLQKFGYLPEDQTDFLFAVICEELGLGGAALVLGLYALLAWTAIGIIRREPDALLRLGGLGVLATVTIQATINLLVVTGLGPTKGIALPLLSAGGSGWVLTAGCLGLLVAMDRRHEPTATQDAAPEPVPA